MQVHTQSASEPINASANDLTWHCAQNMTPADVPEEPARAWN
jgi:hypothetical protein